MHEWARVGWWNSDSLDLQKQLSVCFARSRLFLWESSLSTDILFVGWSCSVPKKDKGSGLGLEPWLVKDEVKCLWMSGLLFPSPGDLSDPEIKPSSLALQAKFFAI